MADNIPVTSVGSELISAGLNQNNPTMTTVDFADQMAKARQEQEAQEQAIARAKELTVQAGIQTQNQQDAQAQGINPLTADYLTPEQAVATLHLILEEKGVPADKDMIQNFVDSLHGKPVNRQVVEEFANRLSGEKTRANQSAKFTTDMDLQVPKGKSAADVSLVDMHDPEGNSVDDKTISDGTFTAHVANDGMYQVIYNNQGQVENYLPGGKEPADPSLKLSEKDSQFWTNQWKSRIANKINPYLASGRTQVGVALQTVTRCARALMTLAHTPVTKQDAMNIILEIGFAYKGGSPDQAAILETKYETLYGDLLNWAQSKIGKAMDVLPDDIKNHLIDRIKDLEDQSKKVVTDSVQAAQALNQDVIDHFPDQWKKFVDEIGKELEDSNNPTVATGTSGKPGEPNPQMDALAGVLKLKKKGQ